MRLAMMRLQKIFRHYRHQGARQDIGRDHREDHRFRERPKKIAGNTAKTKHRHESDANAKHRDRSRDHDLPRAVENGLFDWFALLEMKVDVF
jgi:hypothetical protein